MASTSKKINKPAPKAQPKSKKVEKEDDEEDKPKPSKTTALEKTKPAGSNLPTKVSYERDAGAGFEGADKDSFALPFLVVLQKNSPQCDEDNGAYIDGAKAGMFLNTATGDLYDGKEGILLVPCAFQRKFNEWVPRDEGGGFRGSYNPDSMDLTKLQRDDSGRMILSNGNHLVDTRYHFCLLLTEEGPQMVVFSLSSTQIKKSRAWMTKMQTLKMIGTGGKKFTPPTFSHAYRVTTVAESNDKGDWKGIQVEIDHLLGKDEEGIYLAAKEFRSQVESGKARVEEKETETAPENY